MSIHRGLSPLTKYAGDPLGLPECFDNALAESFNAAVKVERVNRTVYPTREHARKDVAWYIESRYNTQRLHSALGYQTPQEVYDEYLNQQSAA
jgi:transposase InsO family protein